MLSSPVVQNLPEIYLRVFEDGENVPLDVVVFGRDGSLDPDLERNEIGKTLTSLSGRTSVHYKRSSKEILSFFQGESASATALILQGLEHDREIIVLTSSLQNPNLIKVFWSWGDPIKRAVTLTDRFAVTWKSLETQSFTPTWSARGLDLSENKMPTLFEHQAIALQSWEANNFQGIFEMCTGAGKTIAALAGSLLLPRRLQVQGRVLSGIVILCPKRVLVGQWERQLLAKGFKVSARVCDAPQNYLGQLDAALRANKPRYVISTYDSFALPRFQFLLKNAAESGRRGLLIADEMHWCASAERRACLRACEKYFPWRLGLSATPEIENDGVATKQLMEYFGGILKDASYGLEEALRDKVLCPYVYHPVPAFLDAETSAQYFDVLRRTSDRVGRTDLAAYSERRRILRKGEMQMSAIETICDRIKASKESFDHTLVFCPPGDDYDDRNVNDDEMIPLINKIKSVFDDREILCTSILANTIDRDRSLKEFENATVSILLAIGCLDEGMDVPSTRRAIMLYSVDRLRQFVQRRGRVLRTHPDKTTAEIFDLIVLPHNAELSESIAEDLLRRELRRYSEFARLAINAEEARTILEDAIRSATRNRK